MNPLNFAKLFNMPNGGQILVTKETNPDTDNDLEADIRYEARFIIDNILATPALSASFRDDESRDEAFEEVTQTQAESVFNMLTDQINDLLN